MKQENRTYYAYLDELRDSGLINMFGAARFLAREFPELSYDKAVSVLQCWMESQVQRSAC